jgi:hypothetical protein
LRRRRPLRFRSSSAEQRQVLPRETRRRGCARSISSACRKAPGSIRRPRISFQISIIRNENVCVAGRPLLVAVQLRPGDPLLVAVQRRPGESGRRHSGAKSDNDKKLFERMFHNGSPERGPLELSGRTCHSKMHGFSVPKYDRVHIRPNTGRLGRTPVQHCAAALASEPLGFYVVPLRTVRAGMTSQYRIERGVHGCCAAIDGLGAWFSRRRDR